MPSRLNYPKRTRGFTLIEVIAAAAVFGTAVTMIVGYMTNAQKARVRIEARRQAVVAAHSRCEMFASGMIYADIVRSLNPNQSATVVTPVSSGALELPGGFAVTELQETITAGPPGARYASIHVHYSVETAQNTPAEATATGLRCW